MTPLTTGVVDGETRDGADLWGLGGRFGDGERGSWEEELVDVDTMAYENTHCGSRQ